MYQCGLSSYSKVSQVLLLRPIILHPFSISTENSESKFPAVNNYSIYQKEEDDIKFKTSFLDKR